MKTVLYHARILSPYREQYGAVVVEDGKISQVLEDGLHKNFHSAIMIDANGLYLAPGFIDTHTHGAGGCDFMDGSVDAVVHACRTHLQYGTTSIVPTTLSSDAAKLEESLTDIEQAARVHDRMPEILGAHLEGPYFSPAQCGAQDARYLRAPDPVEYSGILSRHASIVKWTVAPELSGALAMGRTLFSRGVVASIGHSDAVEEQVVRAIENGYTCVTHLYNAMSRLTRRDAKMYLGVAESTLLHDALMAEIIADGRHLPLPLLQLIYKAKGAQRICLVTDSMRAAGTDAAESVIGSLRDGQRVEIEDGVAYMPGRKSFGGSVCTADRLVRTMWRGAGVPLLKAVEMMTLTPAKLLGVATRKGSVSVGMDADLVLFDENVQIKLVMVMGKIWVNRTG